MSTYHKKQRHGAQAAAALILASAITASTSLAATNKSGLIAGETWSKAMSPIRVVGDITVANLTIQPGVEVLFTGNYTFDCLGVLKAHGGEGVDRIWFHGDTGITWQGIGFPTGSPGSVMDYCIVQNSSATGIAITDCFPAISNCEIMDNSTTGVGGGVWISLSNVQGTLVLSGCTIKSNTSTVGAGGGVYVSAGANAVVRFTDCEFINNVALSTSGYASGGGAYFYGAGKCELLRCPFRGNQTSVIGGGSNSSGGGVFSSIYSLSLRNCELRSNIVKHTGYGYSMGGGFSAASGNVSLYNCCIRENSESAQSATIFAGGMFLENSSARLENCTIVNNPNKAIYSSGPLTVINSLIYFNNANGTQVTGSATITYSDVQNGYAGTGNIYVNPILDSVTAKISRFSSCVDAGNPSPAYDDLVFDPPAAWGSYGTLRNDMGAYGGPGAALWESGSYPLRVFPPSGGGLVGVGDTVTLKVSVGGVPPYTYLWKKSGVSITDIPGHLTGATTDTLTITHATSADDGEYTVDVTNAFGTTTSSVTKVAIDPLRVNVKMFAGVVIQAAVGTTVRVECSNDLSSGGWTTLTQLVLSTSPYTYYDADSPNHPKRFYRATEVE